MAKLIYELFIKADTLIPTICLRSVDDKVTPKKLASMTTKDTYDINDQIISDMESCGMTHTEDGEFIQTKPGLNFRVLRKKMKKLGYIMYKANFLLDVIPLPDYVEDSYCNFPHGKLIDIIYYTNHRGITEPLFFYDNKGKVCGYEVCSSPSHYDICEASNSKTTVRIYRCLPIVEGTLSANAFMPEYTDPRGTAMLDAFYEVHPEYKGKYKNTNDVFYDIFERV